jgi:hypothetical protein
MLWRFLNILTIVRITRQSGALDAKLAAPPLSGQHVPAPL